MLRLFVRKTFYGISNEIMIYLIKNEQYSNHTTVVLINFQFKGNTLSQQRARESFFICLHKPPNVCGNWIKVQFLLISIFTEIQNIVQ